MERQEPVEFIGKMMKNNPNSNDVLFGSFRKEHDTLTPNEVALLETRRDNGLTKSPSEGTRSETESSTNSVLQSNPSQASTFFPPSVVSRASKASWRKGLMVLERRQKERGIINPSLSIFTEGSTLAGNTKFSGTSIASNTYLSAENTKTAPEGTGKRVNPTNLYDQLMENPSQILGISTSSSGTLEEDEASLESAKKGAVRLTKNYACTTTDTAGGSFDMIAFHDIKSPPTASELSQSSECWVDEKKFTDADEFTSTDDMKKKFQSYIELSGLNAKPRESSNGSITWSNKSIGGRNSRRRKWAKSKAKAVRSFRRTKTRLILKAANLQLSAQVAVEELKKRKQKEDKADKTTCETNIGSKPQVQKRMMSALSKKMSSVSSKALGKNISSVSSKIMSKNHKDKSESAIHSIEPVASASGNVVITLQAYQDPTNSLKSPAGKPSGVAALTKKKIAPLNKYIQRKSFHCKAGTSKAISKLRQSVKTHYTHFGHKIHPETESAIPPLVEDLKEDAILASLNDDEKEERINDSGASRGEAQNSIPDPMAKETDVEIKDTNEHAAPENLQEDVVEPMEAPAQTRLIPPDIALGPMEVDKAEADLRTHGSVNKPVVSLEDTKPLTILADTAPVIGLNHIDSSFKGEATVPVAECLCEKDNQNKLNKSEIELSPVEDSELQITAIDLVKQPSTGKPNPTDSVDKSKSDHHEVETKAKIAVAELPDVGGENSNGIEVSEDENSYDELDVIPIDGPNDNQTENITAKALSLSKFSSKMKRISKRHSWHSKKEHHDASKSPSAAPEDSPVCPHSGKSKLAKLSIPKMIPRPKKAHIMSRTTPAAQKLNGGSENTIDEKLQEPSQRKDACARQIPDVLPLKEKYIVSGGSCAGSQHSAGGVSASIVEMDGENVEMVAEMAFEADLDGVHATPVDDDCEDPIASCSQHLAPANPESQQIDLSEGGEQHFSHLQKEKGSITLRAMSFLKSKRRTSSGAADDSRSNLPRHIDETNTHRSSETPQDSKLTDAEANTPRTAGGKDTEAEDKAVDVSSAIVTSASALVSPKEETNEMEMHAPQEPRTDASEGKGGDSLQKSSCSGTEESSAGKPDAFLPRLNWLVPSFFCGANDGNDIPEGWVDGCAGGMDSNGLGSLSSSSTLSSDVVLRHVKKHDTPCLDGKSMTSLSASDAGSPEVYLSKILSFNCYGCEDGCDDGGFDLADSLSSVTDNSTLVGTIVDTIVEHKEVVEKKPELSKTATTKPRKANGEADAKNTAPSQWIEFKERQTETEKVHEEKTATARRGVAKLFRLVKRKQKTGKAADPKGGGGSGAEWQRKAHDAGNGENEASLVSYLSERGVSAVQSWGNNSDVFSGVVSKTSPRHKFAQK